MTTTTSAPQILPTDSLARTSAGGTATGTTGRVPAVRLTRAQRTARLQAFSATLLCALRVDDTYTPAYNPTGAVLDELRDRLKTLSSATPTPVHGVELPAGGYQGVELRDPFTDHRTFNSIEQVLSAPVPAPGEVWSIGFATITRTTLGAGAQQWPDLDRRFERWLTGPQVLGSIMPNWQLSRLRHTGMSVTALDRGLRAVCAPVDRLENWAMRRVA